MKVAVTISRELDASWATPEQLAELSDGEVIELVNEDLFAFADGACYSISREEL